MTSERKVVALIAAAAVALSALLIVRTAIRGPRRYFMAPFIVKGAVLRDDEDPRKQSPLENTRVTVSIGFASKTGTSAASGLFMLTLRPGVFRGESVTLRFEHPHYRSYEIKTVPEDKLYIVRMEPVFRTPVAKLNQAEKPAKIVRIKDVVVRYSVQNETTVDVGTVAKEFDVPNSGHLPCKNHRPCSPDGKWKASLGSLSIDADARNTFRNVRVSCIAGPCPFTQIENSDLSTESRKKTISVLNWSDTASFLVEAEVIRIMVADLVRHSHPFIIGPSMTFALPIAAEGLSIEAEVDGQEIVFPLGPDPILPWATCSVETSVDHNRTYRCTVKNGYELEQ